MIASSLSLGPESRHKHAERRPEARAHARDPAEGRQTVRHADHPRDLERDVLHAPHHPADPLQLAVGRLRQRPHVRRQRLDLARQRVDLPLHQLQHHLRPGRRPPAGPSTCLASGLRSRSTSCSTISARDVARLKDASVTTSATVTTTAQIISTAWASGVIGPAVWQTAARQVKRVGEKLADSLTFPKTGPYTHQDSSAPPGVPRSRTHVAARSLRGASPPQPGRRRGRRTGADRAAAQGGEEDGPRAAPEPPPQGAVSPNAPPRGPPRSPPL